MGDCRKNQWKPLYRSAARLAMGKAYYSFRRHLFWAMNRSRFAEKHTAGHLLPEIQYHHETPLLRQLKDVDMVYQYNKIVNLRLAVKRLDGLILRPGELFSYWKLIGRPSYRKGYVDGMVLRGGRVTMGVGGGLCQLSNLIYWMTLHTPLTVVERHRHGYDVFPDSNRTQPFGSGATCFYPYGDLMIRNETEDDFQLCLRVGTENLEGEWRSVRPGAYRYEVVERNHCMRSEYRGGFSRHNELYLRRYSLDGGLLDEKLITENHALMMYSPFLPDPARTGGISPD